MNNGRDDTGPGDQARRSAGPLLLYGPELADPALVANKFARLEQMRQAGLPVPAFFCLTAAAFDDALELLRWSWLSHTGGQPHVATQDVPLTDAVITRGQVVIPLVDAANRDASVFPDADEFRPGRTPNPPVALGYGRHMCLGAPTSPCSGWPAPQAWRWGWPACPPRS